MMQKWLMIPLVAVGMMGAVRAEQPVVTNQPPLGISPPQQQPPVQYVNQQGQPIPGQPVTQVIVERDPALGAVLPEGKLYESKKGWDFDDDELVFKNQNRNGDGKRYLIWKDYYWVIGDNEITVLDPRPFGTSITASRHQLDRKGKIQSDNKVMDNLKDQAGDLRRSREPYGYGEPVPVVGIGVGLGFGGYYGPGYYRGGPGYYRGGYAPRYRYR